MTRRDGNPHDFELPWGAWFEDGVRRFALPGNFEIAVCKMRGGAPVPGDAVLKAIRSPVGTPALRDLARGRESAVIAVEDLTRPARLTESLPIVIAELEEAGIAANRIEIIAGIGAHAPMNREELVKKLGADVIRRFDVSNHHPYENLVDLGVSERGIPIHINRRVVNADLKIAMGSVVPHPYAGFSGGAKIVLPGVAGIETLEANHRPVVTGVHGGLGKVEGNTAREEMERIALKVGLEFIVNVLTDDSRMAVDVFAGHPVDAHRAAVKSARRIYSTPRPPWTPDAVVLNAYPKDTEMLQVGNAFNVLRSAGEPVPVAEDGMIVVTAACSTGRGYHSLHGRDMRLYRNPREREYLSGRTVVVYSPLLSEADVRVSFWEGYPFESSWEGVVSRLEAAFPAGGRLAVFPCAPIQLLEPR